MGHVILPTGSTVFVDELSGSINLSQLINDAQCEDYTASYRISTIAALGRLGKHAAPATPFLSDLAKKSTGNAHDRLLADAAGQAVKKIEEGGTATASTSSSRANETYGPVDNRYGRNYTSNNTAAHNNTSYSGKKCEVHKVTFTELDEENAPLDTGLKVYCRCNFCGKMTVANAWQREFSDRLAGADKFFCNFCIRNDYYQMHSKNVMLLTYRGIVGYYYYSYYVVPKQPTMYLNDIQDYIELHVKAGLQNPVFRYDPETFCWFVDFSKVGKRKMPVEAVLRTIGEQLACFNLYENVRNCSPRKLYHKYQQAVMEFYQHRTRTDGDQVFAPTLVGCDIPTRCPAGTRALPADILQSFSPSNLVDNSSRTSRVRH